MSNIPLDILDILIASVLIYGLIVLLKQTRSQKIIEGIAIISAIYLLALTLDLELLLSIFRLFLPVLLIALVIIFQEEFRRFFEFLGVLPARYSPLKKHAEHKYPIVDNIMQAIDHLVSRKIGAIIVLRGDEPLERHLKGGFALNGKVSAELLESLFDTHSPGHDGAVIIDYGIITQFGARLPLSQNNKELEGYGTRHAAGLGLSEQSDAFIIIISEEKGTTTVATSGGLRKFEDSKGLHEALSAFYEQKFPKKYGAVWKNLAKRHSRDKFVAIIIAIILWFFLIKN